MKVARSKSTGRPLVARSITQVAQKMRILRLAHAGGSLEACCRHGLGAIYDYGDKWAAQQEVREFIAEHLDWLNSLRGASNIRISEAFVAKQEQLRQVS